MSVNGPSILGYNSTIYTTGTTPTMGKINQYNASGGTIMVTMPSMAGYVYGNGFTAQKYSLDKTGNLVIFVCATGETFTDGSTMAALWITGEQRQFQIVNNAGTKCWKGIGPINPVPSNDIRYLYRAAKAPVQLTDNCYCYGLSTTHTAVGTAEYHHNVGITGTDIQLVFGLFQSGISTPIVDTDPATTVTFSAAVRDAVGNVYQCTFGGLRLITIGGGGTAITDPLPIEVTAGDVIYSRVYQSAGTSYVNRVAIGTLTGGGGFTATTDLTASGSAAVGAASHNGWGPMAIIGTPTGAVTPKSILVPGDSIALAAADGFLALMAGYYTPNPDVYAGGGWIMRALSSQAGVINGGVASDQMTYFDAQLGHFRRASFAKYAKFALIEDGVNDIHTAGRTAVQLQTDILTCANRHLTHGIVKNIIPTITPVTSSTDGWATLANQTLAGANSVRVAHNTWVRGGAPIDPSTFAPVAVGTSGALTYGQPGHPLCGFVDVAAAVESSLNSGKWAVPNRIVTDGTITSAAFGLGSATAAFVSGDVGRTVMITGAGASGANLYSFIKLINSGVLVQIVGPAAGTTVSGATVLIGPMTQDGTHPSGSAHKIIAAAVGPALLALMT